MPERLGQGSKSGNVLLDVCADLAGVMRVSSSFGRLHVGDHLVGRARGNRAVQCDRSLLTSSEKLRQRQATGLAYNVPAGHIQRRLDVRVAWKGQIHGLVDAIGLSRVFAEDRRGELLDPRPNASRKGRQIGRAPGAALAPAAEPFIRFQLGKGGVELVEVEPAARERVAFN